MRYVAAYLLAALGSKGEPTAADLQKILSSVGIDADGEKVQKVVSELKGKDLEEIIAEGTKKLSSVPSGGAASAPAGAASGSAGAAPAEEAKKEEKKEESEESDDDMGFGLFD